MVIVNSSHHNSSDSYIHMITHELCLHGTIVYTHVKIKTNVYNNTYASSPSENNLHSLCLEGVQLFYNYTHSIQPQPASYYPLKLCCIPMMQNWELRVAMTFLMLVITVKLSRNADKKVSHIFHNFISHDERKVLIINLKEKHKLHNTQSHRTPQHTNPQSQVFRPFPPPPLPRAQAGKWSVDQRLTNPRETLPAIYIQI